MHQQYRPQSGNALHHVPANTGVRAFILINHSAGAEVEDENEPIQAEIREDPDCLKV
jgi:hypothetical protein